jgi:hypothetical protein
LHCQCELPHSPVALCVRQCATACLCAPLPAGAAQPAASAVGGGVRPPALLPVCQHPGAPPLCAAIPSRCESDCPDSGGHAVGAHLLHTGRCQCWVSAFLQY